MRRGGGGHLAACEGCEGLKDLLALVAHDAIQRRQLQNNKLEEVFKRALLQLLKTLKTHVESPPLTLSSSDGAWQRRMMPEMVVRASSPTIRTSSGAESWRGRGGLV